MNIFNRFLFRLMAGAALALALLTPAFAAAGDYANTGGYNITPPYSPDSFTTILAAFPVRSKRLVSGYPIAGRLIAATGKTIYMLKTFGSSDWLPVAVLDGSDFNLEPAFLEVTPDGEKVAVGVGLGKPLYVVPTKLLSVAKPVVLTTDPGVRRYDGLNYYSAAFHDSRYLFINAGGAVLGDSYIYAIDTESSSGAAIPIIDAIPGASGGIAFNAAGDLVTGIGWDANGVTTGELRIFDVAALDDAVAGGASLDYVAKGTVIATGMLSADSLGFDDQGTLCVGGGDVFGPSGHFGYAEVISASAIADVRAGGAPVTPDSAGVTRIQPDPCHNDDWTGATFVPGIDMLVVSSNLASTPPNCETTDWSFGPPTPRAIYFTADAPDSDHDGTPDGVDPDYAPRQVIGRGELSKLVNALDSISTGASFDATVDFDLDGRIGDADFAFLQSHWGQPAAP
jgi:hypothetical protein